ncbi:MAG: hypothetical protein HYR63_21135 [Proteobacteria bacterium]|nr:hypothetical protein [Pseudomonadota bacterium]
MADDEDDSIERILAELLRAALAHPDLYFKVVDTATAAKITGHAPATLVTRRSRGGGPTFVGRGKRGKGYVMYDLLRANILARRRHTADPGPDGNLKS